jgi:hypothetical protein
MIKKHVYHNNMIEKARILALLGNIYWDCDYLLMCLSMTSSEIMDANIAKLRKRYPEGFDSKLSMKKLDELDSN